MNYKHLPPTAGKLRALGDRGSVNSNMKKEIKIQIN